MEFLYSLANSGESSGGHTAIRIQEDVYHWQYKPDKIFYLVREPWIQFRLSYNSVQNRPIVITPLSPSKKGLENIERNFNRIYVLQTKQLETLHAMEEDLSLFEKKISTKDLFSEILFPLDTNEVKIQNFLRISSEKLAKDFAKIPQEDLQVLENSIGAVNLEKESIAYSPKLRERKRILENQLSSFFEKDSFAISQQYELKIPELQFTKEDENILFNLQKQKLEERKNLRSSSPNFFGALFWEGSKRISLLQKTISEKVWASYPQKSRQNRIGNLSFPNLEAYLRNFRNQKTWESLVELQNAIGEYALQGKESEIAKWEKNHFAFGDSFWKEFENTISLGDTFENREHLKEFQRISENYLVKLQDHYYFHLITHNCTTQLVSNVETSFLNSTDMEKNLGASVQSLFHFVPFVASDLAKEKWSSQEQKTIANHRSFRKKLLAPNQSLFRKHFLEETSVFSSSYRFNEKDEWFLFFTDEQVFPRPIYGILNLGIGLSEFGLGVLILPFDRARKLQRGWNGIVNSGVEVLFFNIRKGTYPHLREEELPNPYE